MNIRVVFASLAAVAVCLLQTESALFAQSNPTPPWNWAESCTITSPWIKGQPRISLSNWQSVDKEGQPVSRVTLSLTVPSADAPVETDEKVSGVRLEIKDGPVWHVDGTRIDRNDNTIFSLQFKESLARLITPLAKRNLLSITLPTTAGEKTYTIQLSGSGNAIVALKNCIS